MITATRKEQMKTYSRNKRGGLKRPAARKMSDRERKDEKNAKAREQRAIEKEAGLRVDKRLKENMTKPHYTQLRPKAKPKPRRKRAVKEKKMGKVIEEPKPLQILNNSTDGKVKLVISPKLTVYIRPDQDPEVVKAKYISFCV